jgi:hypothetical protein
MVTCKANFWRGDITDIDYFVSLYVHVAMKYSALSFIYFFAYSFYLSFVLPFIYFVILFLDPSLFLSSFTTLFITFLAPSFVLSSCPFLAIRENSRKR